MKSTHYLAVLLVVATALIAEGNPYDLNKDKRITWDEFAVFQGKEAEKNARKFDEQQVRFLFMDKDQDADGVLSYQEFARNPVDINGDKFISYEEYAITMRKRGERSGRVPSESWMKAIFAKKDTDGDGALTYQEMANPVK